MIRLVVLDAMGVLYQAGDDVADVLIPYCRELGCVLTDAEIEVLYRGASLGRLTSAEFWAACGINGNDEAYCSRHELMPDIVLLLKDLRHQSVHLACLSNDVAEWSRILRQRFGLDEFIDTWIISGDVGVRKPDLSIFSALSDATDIPFGQMMFFDDREANVSAGRDAGMDARLVNGAAGIREAAHERGLLPEL